jgi:hypothetical protein
MMSNYSVGDKIITPGGKLGEVSSVQAKITITWDNGLSAEYTPKQLQAWKYQIFLEEKKAIAPCLNNSIYAVGWAQDSALQACNSDLNLLESQRLTSIAQTSSANDTQTYTTTATCETPEHLDLPQEQLTSSQLRLPAPHFPQKANVLEQTTSETVSPPSSKLSKPTSPDLSPSKMLQDSSPAPTGQTQNISIFHTYSDSLPSAGTMRNGLLSAVDTLPVPSLEKDYCWLRSPGALSSTGKGRPPGQTKQESELKKLGLLNKGEVLNPAILCQWYEIPESWLDPLECRAATELLETGGQQQEIFSILESPPLPLQESSTLIPCVENQQLQRVKAITLHQPWAYLVGRYKWFETRSWLTNYRGKIAIHAAKKQHDTEEWCSLLQDLLPPVEELIFGAVVAIADLTDCILMTEELINQQPQIELRCGNWKPGRYAWKLKNIQILPEPIPAKGKQGLWNIELSIPIPHPPTKANVQLETDIQVKQAPEKFLEETEPATTSTEKPKHRQRKGCLYKYIENKKLKNGTIASYPRVIGNRKPDNPTHWRWGFNWEEKVDGEWKGRSIGSVPVGAIAMIQSMQKEGVPLEEIIGFIKRAKSKQ